MSATTFTRAAFVAVLLAGGAGCGGAATGEPRTVVDTGSTSTHGTSDGSDSEKPRPRHDKPEENEGWRPGLYMAQAVGRVTGAAREFEQNTKFGFDEDASCVLGAYIDDGNEVALTRPMRGGKSYVLIGGGSDGIGDLDLAVEDANGKILAADTMDDAAPVVTITPPSNGKYRIRLVNAKNGQGGGFAVVAILREGGFTIPIANIVRSFGRTIDKGGAASKLVQQRVKGTAGLVFHTGGEWSFFGTILAHEESISTGGLDLGGSMSVIIAGADGQSQDVDLSVTDTTTNAVVSRDEDDDAEPAVVVSPEPGHTYKVTTANMKSKGPSLVTTLVLDAEPE
jgi:hypothetical protein